MHDTTQSYIHSFCDVARHVVVVEILFSIVHYGRYAIIILIIFLWVVFSEFLLPHFFFSIPREYFFFSPAYKMRTVCSDTEELVDS